MRRLQSYIDRYGHEHGPVIYRVLQKEAAQARWKAYYRDHR